MRTPSKDLFYGNSYNNNINIDMIILQAWTMPPVLSAKESTSARVWLEEVSSEWF
jgi:hypothetical protein